MFLPHRHPMHRKLSNYSSLKITELRNFQICHATQVNHIAHSCFDMVELGFASDQEACPTWLKNFVSQQELSVKPYLYCY